MTPAATGGEPPEAARGLAAFWGNASVDVAPVARTRLVGGASSSSSSAGEDIIAAAVGAFMRALRMNNALRFAAASPWAFASSASAGAAAFVARSSTAATAGGADGPAAAPEDAARVAMPQQLSADVTLAESACAPAVSRVRAASKARPIAGGTSAATLPRPRPRAAFAGGGR